MFCLYFDVFMIKKMICNQHAAVHATVLIASRSLCNKALVLELQFIFFMKYDNIIKTLIGAMKNLKK